MTASTSISSAFGTGFPAIVLPATIIPEFTADSLCVTAESRHDGIMSGAFKRQRTRAIEADVIAARERRLRFHTGWSVQPVCPTQVKGCVRCRSISRIAGLPAEQAPEPHAFQASAFQEQGRPPGSSFFQTSIFLDPSRQTR